MSNASAIISQAQSTLGSLLEDVKNSIDTLSDIGDSSTFFGAGTYNSQYRDLALSGRTPALDAGTLATPVFPDAPAFNGLAPDVAIDDARIPIPPAPGLDIPCVPQMVDVKLPNAPQVIALSIPDAPLFVYPTIPRLVDIGMPVSPEVILPSFDADMLFPRTALGEFNYAPEYAEREWAQALPDAQFSSWLQALWNGDNIEEGSRIFEAGRDRLVAESVRTRREMLDSMAARGIPAGSGVMAAGLYRVITDAQNKIADLNRDITQKRADILVQQQGDAAAKALQFIDLLKRYAQAAQERLLSAQKLCLEAAVSKMDYNIKKYNAELDYLRTRVQVYEAEIRAALNKIEVYKAEIDAEKLKSDVNTQRVQQYAAQMQAEQVKAATYSALVDAVKSRVDVQRAQLDAYRTEVDAQIAKLKINDSRVQLYTAQLGGERTKVDMYSAQAQAAGTVAETLRKVAESRLDTFKAALSMHQAALATHEAQVQAGGAEFDAQLRARNVSNDAKYKTAMAGIDIDKLRAELVSISTSAANHAQSLNQAEASSTRQATLAALQNQVSAAGHAANALGVAFGAASASIVGVAMDQSIENL